MNSANIFLRTLTHAPYTTLGRRLTYAEGDQRIIELADAVLALGANINPFDPSFNYIGGTTYYVSYANNIWKFISLVDQMGVTPPTPPATSAVWELSSVGAALAAGQYIYRELADAQTDAANGDLIRDSLYLVFGIYDTGGFDNYIYVKAISPTQFAPYGVGAYQNNSMTQGMFFQMGYDVTGDWTGQADFMFYLYEPKYDNEIWQSGTGIETIEKMPLDGACDNSLNPGDPGSLSTSRFRNNRLRNVIGTWNARRTHLLGVDADTCTINTSKTSTIEDVLISSARISFGSSLSLHSETGSYIFAPVGTSLYGAAFSGDLQGDVTCYRASIGGNILGTIDTTQLTAGYVFYNGFLDGYQSTFGVDGAMLAGLNPDGSGNVDLSQVAWAQFIGIKDISASSSVISISGGTPGRNYTFYNATGTGGALTFDNSGGTLKMSAPTAVLNEGDGSIITFNYQGGNSYERARSIII